MPSTAWLGRLHSTMPVGCSNTISLHIPGISQRLSSCTRGPPWNSMPLPAWKQRPAPAQTRSHSVGLPRHLPTTEDGACVRARSCRLPPAQRRARAARACSACPTRWPPASSAGSVSHCRRPRRWSRAAMSRSAGGRPPVSPEGRLGQARPWRIVRGGAVASALAVVSLLSTTAIAYGVATGPHQL
jgi:hypothetical protein